MPFSLPNHDDFNLPKIDDAKLPITPLTGDVFLFFPRHRRSVKVLRWDGDGFILYHKRLERGTFEIPPFDAASGAFRMPYTTLELIMRGVSLRSARYRNRMRIGFS